MILFLVKVFEREEYANDFLMGKMFINPLSYFKKIEGDDGRGDEYEGAIIFPLESAIITLKPNDPETGESWEHTLTRESGLAAAPVVQPNWFDHINVFCMYAGHTGDFLNISSDNIQDFKKQLEIPDDCISLGRYAVVITNVTEFIKRVDTAAEQNRYGILRHLVKYYDPEVGTPPAQSDIETIFNKRKEFEYQREFRFAIDTCTMEDNSIILDIGDIGDIAYATDTADVNQQLCVRTNDPQ